MCYHRICVSIICLLLAQSCFSQLQWTKVDSLFGPLPSSLHVYRTTDLIEGKPNIAYYVEADLNDKHLQFATDTTLGRRLTPKQYYERNGRPLIGFNGSFFEFVHNSNLNLVMNDGKILANNQHSIPGKGKDTFTYNHTLVSAIGISKKRKADVAWTYTEAGMKWPIAFEKNPAQRRGSFNSVSKYLFAPTLHHAPAQKKKLGIDEQWKMQTAMGGGPVLVHDGIIRITNNEEAKFSGKAIEDKHPRTAMGYTKDGKLIILLVQGRFKDTAEGATLKQEAQILKDLGCWEALNLDGGGSSCMLVNGIETIKPSDKEGERPLPAVFMVK